MDPDLAVQNALNLFFKTFKRTGSACATLREFNRLNLKIPKRFLNGLRKGELAWNPLTHSRSLRLLHNPIYAGIYYYGRQQVKKTVNGKKSLNMPIESWHAYMPDAHPGYITRDRLEENVKKLKENSCAYGEDRRKGPPREGPALPQGIIVCGKCGKRMSVRYQKNCSKLVPIYTCMRDLIENGAKMCQIVMGEKVDEEISKMLLEMLNPLAIKAAIKVEDELKKRKLEADSFYRQQVERAKYDMEIARKRYMLVDPQNRLVATELEAEWNLKIRKLEKLKKEYEKKREDDLKEVTKTTKSDIMQIANDFARIWGSANVSFRDRKRIIRLLIEDVTVKNNDKKVIANIRFRQAHVKLFLLKGSFPYVKLERQELI